MQKTIISLLLISSINAYAGSFDCGQETKHYMQSCQDGITAAKANSANFISALQARVGSDPKLFATGGAQAAASQNGMTNITSAIDSCKAARKNCSKACDDAARANKEPGTLEQIKENDQKCKDYTENRLNGLNAEAGNLRTQGIAGGNAVSANSR